MGRPPTIGAPGRDKRSRRLGALGGIALLLLAGCDRCAPTPPAQIDAGTQVELDAPELLPTPRPWTFREVRGPPAVAAPEGCTLRAPTLKGDVPLATGFVAERASLATLLVASATEDRARLTGAGAMRFDASGSLAERRPFPWFLPAAVPRLGRTLSGGWIASLGEQTEAGAWRLGVWRDGRVELVGDGDRFEAIDLWCDHGRCALLTPRLGPVALPGAEVRVGAADAPVAAWRRITIEPADPESDAHPLAIAGLEARAGGDAGASGSVVVALVEKSDCVFFRVDDAGAREMDRLPAPHGVLDVLAVPGATAMLHGRPMDEQGCVARDADGAEAVVRFAQAGAAAEIKAPAPPLRGALRRLSRGALATWIAPLGCGAERRAVYGVRLDETGKPAGAVLPVGDAERYAVASERDDVDLWLQQGTSVTWMRLRCAGTQ